MLELSKNDNMYIVRSLRLDVFNKNGEFIKKIHLPKFLKNFVVTPEKYIIGNFMMMEDFDGKQQLVDSVAVINPEGQLLRTFAKFPYRKPVLSQAFSGNALIAGDSFSPNLVYCPLTDGFSVYGYPSIYKINVLDSTGKISSIIRKIAAPVPVTSKEKKDAVKTIEENLDTTNLQARIKGNFPKYQPYYNKILSDKNNNLFVQKATKMKRDQIPNTYDMFNHEGYYLFEFEFSENPFDIFHFDNGFIYSKMKEPDTGYQRIIRFKIENWEIVKKNLKNH